AVPAAVEPVVGAGVERLGAGSIERQAANETVVEPALVPPPGEPAIGTLEHAEPEGARIENGGFVGVGDDFRDRLPVRATAGPDAVVRMGGRGQQCPGRESENDSHPLNW